MTIDTYATLIPLPAPVTSGTTAQSYTDPNGDVWLAKNGVSGGAWRKARDVARIRCYLGANQAVSGQQNVTMTAVNTDPLTCFASGGFTAPVAGTYLANAFTNLSVSPSAVGDIQQLINQNGTTCSFGNVIYFPASSAGWPGASCTDFIVCAVGDSIQSALWTTLAVTALGNAARTYLDVQYLGP